MSIQYLAPGFELMTFWALDQSSRPINKEMLQRVVLLPFS